MDRTGFGDAAGIIDGCQLPKLPDALPSKVLNGRMCLKLITQTLTSEVLNNCNLHYIGRLRKS